MSYFKQMKYINIKTATVLLFVLSGMCSLIYEVAWAKYLALLIGHSGYSHMIVLATFMGGLALGTFFWGKYSDKVANHLQLYGIIEIAIGVYCLAYPFIIGLAGNVFIHTASSFGGSGNQAVQQALKFILSFFTLILPTFLMGGTLPVLTKFVSKKICDSGKDIAVLYSINSLGALIGTGLAGFFLIRKVGVDNTVWMAAFFNIWIGITAIAISKSEKLKFQSNPLVAHNDLKQDIISESASRIALITALASGFIAMLYELSWIRLLSNILGSSTYSFTMMLIAFISGIALGSLVVSFMINKIKNRISFLATCQFGTALSMILMLPLYERLPYYLVKISAQIPNTPDNFHTFLTCEFLLCFAIMVLPTIFSGMSLPVASRLAINDIRFVGKSIGGIFSINTIGSVIGALVTGLVLIPALGIKSTLELGILSNGLLGFVILVMSKVSMRLKLGLTSVFVLLIVGCKLFLPDWNQNFLISGVFRTINIQEIPSYSELKRQQNEGQKIVWYREGVNANVAVRESTFGDTIQKTLVINGKTDASSMADLNTQVLLGQIPLMLGNNTGHALVIGLGSGITCGSVLRHPVEALDVVEIASEVVECNHYFSNENNHFISDPRAKIYIDDATSFLKTSSKKYNCIISEPSNPWIAGISDLYSVEFFNRCKSQMNTGGVLAQWFHTYDVSNEIFKLVLNTVSEVFPFVSIWKATDADIILLASVTPLSISFNEMEQKMKEPLIAQELARINMYDVPALLSTQVVSARNNPYAFNKSEVNTEKKPLLEFLAPVSLFTHESVSILDSLDERFTFQDKNLWFSEYIQQRPLTFENCMNIARYRFNSQIGDLAVAYTALKKGLEMAPDHKEVRAFLEKTASDLRMTNLDLRNAQLEELRMMYEKYPYDNSAVFAYLNALVEYYRMDNSIVYPQQMDDAVELIKKSILNFPGEEERFHYILAMIFTGAGRYDEAAEAFERLLKFHHPDGTGSSMLSENELIYNIAECYYNAGVLTKAEEYLERLKSVEADNENTKIMRRKIAWKKSGYK